MHVLILDDAEQTDLGFMKKAALELGFHVEATSDPDQFRRAAHENRPDFQVVDVKLPALRQRPGFSNGPELVAVTAAEGPHIPTVFLTNYKGDCDQFVAALDPRLIATTVEKPVSASPTDWQDRLRDGITTIKAKPGFDEPQRLDMPVAELLSNFFRLSPDELAELDEDQRDQLESQVSTELHAFLRSAWNACDADWLILQQIEEAVLITNRGGDSEFPNSNMIAELETKRESPVLIAGRPRVIEELAPVGPVECPPGRDGRDWRRYPFVRLIVGSGSRDFHLDTGSPDSYISREFLDSVVSFPSGRSKRTVVTDLGGREEVLSQLPVSVELHVSGPHGNTALSVLLQVVKNWTNTRILNPKCKGGLCPDSLDGQCGRRLGLIGRDLLYSADDVVWHFNPSNSQFYAVPPISEIDD
jgi:CheY-like chemotaxis protein